MMSQARRGEEEEEEESGQAQLVRERSHSAQDADAKLVGNVTHDQLCDAIHEEVINSEMSQRDVSSLSLQDKQRSENNPSRQRG